MGFWSNLAQWISGDAERDDPDSISAHQSVAVLDDPPDVNVADAEDEASDSGWRTVESLPAQALPDDARPWWEPAGETITVPPRVDRADDMDSEVCESEALASLEATLGDPHIELPNLPHIPQQVLLLTRREDVAMQDIAKLISQDQVLSADLLRHANSVLYGGRVKVKDLQTALARLGMRGIRSFTIGQSVKQLTIMVGRDGTRSRGEELWRQSLVSAYVMASFAETFHRDSNDAFLVGLLHDIGKVVVLRTCHEVEQQTRTPVSDAMFEYLCQEYHELMGEMIAECWQLPENIGVVLGSHHGPLSPEDPHSVDRALIQLSDAATSLLGYGPQLPYDLLNTPAARHLELERNASFRDILKLLPEAVALAMSEN